MRITLGTDLDGKPVDIVLGNKTVLVGACGSGKSCLLERITKTVSEKSTVVAIDCKLSMSAEEFRKCIRACMVASGDILLTIDEPSSLDASVYMRLRGFLEVLGMYTNVHVIVASVDRPEYNIVWDADIICLHTTERISKGLLKTDVAAQLPTYGYAYWKASDQKTVSVKIKLATRRAPSSSM